METSGRKYLDQLATVYDRKTEEGINIKLAEEDSILLNHSGLVLPDENVNELEKGISEEKDFLRVLHDLEKNLVFFASKHLGEASDNKHILDAGSGAGGSAILVHKELGYEIDGYTLSEKQKDFANRAAKKYGFSDKVRFYKGDMLNLSGVSDNTFDAIWACESTEHVSLENMRVMFREFARVTKSKSRIVITAWTSRAGLHKDGKRIKEAIDEHYLTDIHTKQDYIQAAEKEEWHAVNTTDLTKMILPYWELRQKSENATGSEKLFIDGYKNNALNYFLYVFDKKVPDKQVLLRNEGQEPFKKFRVTSSTVNHSTRTLDFSRGSP